MRRPLFSLIAVVVMCFHAYAQQLSGHIMDEKTSEALPYVNIGVLKRGVGTVTNESGAFNMALDSISDTDSIRISMLGYEAITQPVSVCRILLLKQSGRIFLKQSSIPLKEATVHSRKLKERVLGNTTDNKNIKAGFSSNDLGCELVIKIKAKRSPSFLQKFNFNISSSIFDTLLFRVNVYNIKNGKPGDPINSKNIIVSTTSKSGWVSVDLKEYDIVAEGDFAIGLEMIKDFRRGDVSKGLYFSAGLLNKNCYYRKASQQDWQKVPVVGLGFYVVVLD